jgi:hypothetical protein
MITWRENQRTADINEAGKSYHSTSPLLNSDSKTAKSFSVQEITRLVEDTYLRGGIRKTLGRHKRVNYLRVVPQTCCENQLDFLA